MKYLLSCIFIFVAGVASAQVWDGGVMKSEQGDGQVVCSHSANNSPDSKTSVTLLSEDGELSANIVRGTEDGLAFDPFGSTGSEVVRLRFSDDSVLSFEPDDTFMSTDYGYEAATIKDKTLVDRLLLTSEDVYVRFEGESKRDFLVDYEVFRVLSNGFAKECL